MFTNEELDCLYVVQLLCWMKQYPWLQQDSDLTGLLRDHFSRCHRRFSERAVEEPVDMELRDLNLDELLDWEEEMQGRV